MISTTSQKFKVQHLCTYLQSSYYIIVQCTSAQSVKNAAWLSSPSCEDLAPSQSIELGQACTAHRTLHTAHCIMHNADYTFPWCTLHNAYRESLALCSTSNWTSVFNVLYSSPCRTMMYNHVRSAELDLTSGFERSSCRLVLPSAAANWPEVEQ